MKLEYLTPGITIIGWAVIFLFNKHFFYKTKKHNHIKVALDSINKIREEAFNFWLNERFVSCNNDLIRLSQEFKRCRQELELMPLTNRENCIRLHSSSRKILTYTARETRDFSKMDKQSKAQLKKYEIGTAYLEELQKILTFL